MTVVCDAVWYSVDVGYRERMRSTVEGRVKSETERETDEAVVSDVLGAQRGASPRSGRSQRVFVPHKPCPLHRHCLPSSPLSRGSQNDVKRVKRPSTARR